MQKWGPITVIEWRDSCSLRGGVWNDQNDLAQCSPSQCRSVGWVVSENKMSITLAAHASETQASGDMCIPKTAVVRRWTLTDPTKRKRRCPKVN